MKMDVHELEVENAPDGIGGKGYEDSGGEGEDGDGGEARGGSC